MSFNKFRGENIQEHNIHLLQILDHSLRLPIVELSGSGKRNALLNLINHRSDIDKMFLYVKYPCRLKYRCLIKSVKRLD